MTVMAINLSRACTLAFACASACALCFGCGLISPSEPEPTVYFNLAAERVPTREKAVTGDGLSVRLRPVRAATHLKERIVWRESEVKLGFYDLRRWAEQPSDMIDVRLRRELFEKRRLLRSVASDAPILEVRRNRCVQQYCKPSWQPRRAIWEQFGIVSTMNIRIGVAVIGACCLTRLAYT